ncbi:MAG: SnoaL-like domain-containing protein [Ferruginibacter sp.]
MNTITEKINHLNQLVVDGKLMDAFELYYDDAVVMQENEQPPVDGKEANRLRELEFLNNIVEFRAATPMHVATGDDISYVTWQYDYTHKEWGIKNYTQVSVQHWNNGKIIKEQFIYSN